VQEKNFAHFLAADIHSYIPQGRIECLWKKGAAPRRAGSFSLSRTKRADSGTLPSCMPVGSLAERLRRAGRLRYPSPVCSTKGDAIDRIAEAIDQLASDVQDSSDQELAARVAELWLMVSALDPELARRQQRYTAPADGAPSA
jgi:hypothetical protein